MTETKSPEELQTQFEEFKEWIISQPHFPKNLDDILLKRFLHSCYYDIDKAKAAAEQFFKIRASAPEIFNDRDPLSPHIQKALSIVNLARLRISGNRNLWIWQLNDPGLDRYDYVLDVKVLLLTIDAWLLEDQDFQERDIGLVDVKDLSLKFITKYNISVAKKVSKYEEEAMPVRLNQLHIVNAAPFIDKIFGLMKPFLRHDITEMVHFHVPKSETLYKFLDKDDLPTDFGGTKGNMEDHMKEVMDLIHRKRDILITDLWKAEKKSKNKTAEIPTEKPTFRSLAID